jgi:acetyl esterase/lipase
MKCSLLLLLGLTVTLRAQSPLVLPLYTGAPVGGVPLTEEPEHIVQKPGDPISRVDHVRMPDIKVYLPAKEKATGAAVVICPGGGYGILAIDHEGNDIAKALNEVGVAGIVCKYRVSGKRPGLYLWPIPLLDARQAMRLTRQHAAEWNLDPQKIGVMGFSAGGHLASCIATLTEVPLAGEDATLFNAKQHHANFAGLIYPVIAMGEAYGHAGSRKNLLGANPDAQVLDWCTTNRHVSKQTPPSFLVSTSDDSGVPCRNSIEFYLAMRANGVKGELHIWEKGGHGYGIIPSRGDVAVEWMPRFQKWLVGFLAERPKP